MSLSAAQIMAVVQAIRWAIRELAALWQKRGEELSESELRLLEERLRERILERTETDREEWNRVIRHLEEIDHA